MTCVSKGVKLNSLGLAIRERQKTLFAQQKYGKHTHACVHAHTYISNMSRSHQECWWMVSLWLLRETEKDMQSKWIALQTDKWELFRGIKSSSSF